ncbi:zinc-binding dehydrogenase [Streptomyces sp. NPDC085524]|uniref:zinc-binding dehydrogenase n=1 Tax=Streptomyces sp. NPDC085524 TaxID=3365728 RepID=UPI0037D861C9
MPALNPQRMHRATAFITSSLRTGTLRPVVDGVFPLEDIVRAHRHMESNTQFGKIVVTVDH